MFFKAILLRRDDSVKENNKTVMLDVLKRSNFLKHLAIKNCEKTILKNI